jgi:hypothetical protein
VPAMNVTDFPQLIGRLVEHRVEFIIVDGVAGVIHGSSRFTQDLDVVYRRSEANLTALVSALNGLQPYLRGAPPGLPFDWSVVTLRMGLNFTLHTSVGDIDLLGEIAGGGNYDQLVPHTIDVELFGFSCRCVDLMTLIHTKRAAGRPKDLEVIAELEAILGERS